MKSIVKGRGHYLAAAVAPLALMPAHAQPVDDGAVRSAEIDDGFADIIVTARKRTERLQDVPVAISAVNAAVMERMNITQTNALAAIVPNVQISSIFGAVQPNFTIRGIGTTNQYALNTASPVGVYVDEAYAGFRPTQGQQLYDLERVEVLRGPQGTLYGRNTTGGAFNFITVKPTLDGSHNGYLLGGIGNFGLRKIEGAGNVLLAEDKLAVRLAGIYRYRDGYLKTVGGGPDYGGIDSIAGRATMVARPAETLGVTLSVYHSFDNGRPIVAIAPGVGPGNTNILGYSRNGLSDDEVQPSPGAAPKDRIRSTGFTLTPVLDLGKFTLTGVTNYEKASYSTGNDCDAGPTNLCAQLRSSKFEQFSQDVRFQYDGSDFDFTGGAYYGWDRLPDYKNTTGFFLFLSDLAPPGLFNPPIAGFNNAALPSTAVIYDVHIRQVRISKALYGEGTYNFTPALSLSLGARLTRDDDRLERGQTAVLDGMRGTPRGSTAPFSIVYDPNSSIPEQRNEKTVFSYRGILKYKLDNDLMIYASHTRGFRGGNYGAVAFVPEEFVYIGAEQADAFEAGIKASALDRRLTFNGNAFYMKYKNQQVQDTVALPGGVLITTLSGLNGKIWGLEGELAFRPIPSVNLGANAGYLRTRYDRGQSLTGRDVGGLSFPFAPKFTAQVKGDWTVWDDGRSNVNLAADAAYTSRYHYDPSHQLGVTDKRFANGSPSYWLVNARAALTIDRYSISLWGRNILNKTYFPFFAAQEGAFGQNYGVLGETRTYGIDVKVRF